MIEIWKDVVGYERLYQVSNLGRVRSLDRITKFKDGRERLFKGCILKPVLNHNGYEGVNLNKNGGKSFRISRLVGNHFIPNPNNLPQINHKDEDKTNNCVSNLEWCTPKYNINYGNGIAKRSKYFEKSVEQVDSNGVIIRRYPSVTSTKEYGFSHKQVGKVVRGERKKHGGYKWRYVDEAN